ncbi:MAG: hypothetical protein ACYCSN_15445 [Acidobacteriaceae bacterium]
MAQNTSSAATQTAAQQAQAQLLANAAHNAQVLQQTQWDWVPFGSNSNTTTPGFALSTPYTFTLQNTSAYLDGIRIWLNDIDIDVTITSGAVTPTTAGIWAMLGTLQVALGNNVYQVNAAAIPLLMASWQKRGNPFNYAGQTTYAFSAGLYGSVNGSTSTVGAPSYAAGHNFFTGYLDVPFAMLEMVYDGDGIMPSLSNAGISVKFTTNASFGGATGAAADAYRNAAYIPSTVTVALGTTSSYGASGQISVWGHVATQTDVMSTSALPPFIVGPAFLVQENATTIAGSTSAFYPFQGQSAQTKLVKAMVIVNNPGEVAGYFCNNDNMVELSLMYDGSKKAVESTVAENPFAIANWLVDQRKLYGDQPPGVFFFDWSAGTDPEYPNDYGYLDLTVYKNAGVKVQYSGTLGTNPQVIIVPVYLNPTLYEAQIG